MPAVPRGIAAVLLCALAGAGLACGGGEKPDRLEPTRKALERALLDNVRRTALLEGTTSVSCEPPGDGEGVGRWDCTLEGRERLTAAVSVARRGGWTTSVAVAPPSTGPRITADGTILGEFNGGVGLLGCCVPLPK